jgi:hypothetical protein
MKYTVAALIGLFASTNAHSYKLVSDPYPSADTGYSVLTHCQLYIDATAPTKHLIVTTGGKHCEFDLDGLTLSTGVHTFQATHLADHPTTPAESMKSNTVTIQWPIPPVPTATMRIPQGFRIVP